MPIYRVQYILISPTDVKMEIPELVQTLKSSILRLPSFKSDNTSVGVVSAALSF